MKFRFLVTCATGEIGSELSAYLAKKGHDLILTARDLSKLKTLSERITKQYSAQKIACYAADLGKPETMQELIEHIKATGVDGIALMPPRPPLLPKDPFAQIQTLTQGLQDCFIGPRFLLQQLIPSLEKSALKSVVMVSGTSSKQPISSPEYEAYNNIRTIWVGSLKTFADIYGPMGIRFNTISPGQVETPTYTQKLTLEANSLSKLPTELLQEKTATVPLRKLAQIHTVIKTIYFFLKSSGANEITAANVAIDAGAVRPYY